MTYYTYRYQAPSGRIESQEYRDLESATVAALSRCELMGTEVCIMQHDDGNTTLACVVKPD